MRVIGSLLNRKGKAGAMTETAQQIVARMGKQQRVTYRVTPEPGSLFPADSIGGQLVAISDLFRELGKNDSLRLKTMLADIKMTDDGAIEFNLVIVNLETT